MGMAGLMSPTSGTAALSGGQLSPGLLGGGAAGGGTSGSLLGGSNALAGGSGLLGSSGVSGSPNTPSLLSNMTPQMSTASPTGGTVTYAPSTAAQGAAQGMLGTGGMNTSGSAAQGLFPASATPTTAAQGASQGMLGTGGTNPTAQTQALASPITPPTGGVSSNNGGDLNGTIGTSASGNQSVSTIGYPTGYNLGQGVNTSPTSLLPNGAVSPTNLGVQQQVTAPSASSVVQQNPLTGPTNWNVTPNQTLSGQYAQLMQKGNPAIQAAEQQVIQANALHGGNNDLMAQTAATMQGSQLALQIGAQDAATYANAAQYNASAANAYASQLNQFTANAALSSQNFQQGVSMMNAQTNQQFQLIAAQINAGAYTTSMNLNANLASTQTSINATMQTMDKQFTQNLALMQAQGNVASQQAYQQYGMNVRLGYLSSISQQQASLMQAIAAIQGNPNITATQAQGGVQNAINEFNTFVTQMGAYASAMMPMGSSFPSPSSSSSSSSAAPVANSPVPTSPVDPSTWPSMGTPIHANTGTTTFMPPVSTSSGSYVPSPVNWSRSQTNPNAP